MFIMFCMVFYHVAIVFIMFCNIKRHSNMIKHHTLYGVLSCWNDVLLCCFSVCHVGMMYYQVGLLFIVVECCFIMLKWCFIARVGMVFCVGMLCVYVGMVFFCVGMLCFYVGMVLMITRLKWCVIMFERCFIM